MILEQAAESETIWYGVEMDTRSVEREVLSAQ